MGITSHRLERPLVVEGDPQLPTPPIGLPRGSDARLSSTSPKAVPLARARPPEESWRFRRS